ncbi:MAG: o-succinylbenzoate synthase [Crocinitomicaceae bacterium]|nr:o-succinylbenzoate synthase [Crocinitomicaceae bacterium]
MKIEIRFEKKTFHFKQPSGTSRGVLTEKHAWFLYLNTSDSPTIIGIGECSIIPGLSADFKDIHSYQEKVNHLCISINQGNYTLENISEIFPSLLASPSILFGLEVAILDLKNGGKGILFDTEFTRGNRKIPINGLIWMGSESFMQEQIESKLKEGFTCIKMKIGAIDFEKEYEILAALRARYSADVLTLRVDANGAFSHTEVLGRLAQLAELKLHSIEQPIKAGNWKEMANICAKTALPIALDEELIGIETREQKIELLDAIQPQYIILKPSLHGGLMGCAEWISLAEERKIPWWITSALESNVGLNAIAQFISQFDTKLHQGLGTGGLYVENTPTNLQVRNGYLEISKAL